MPDVSLTDPLGRCLVLHDSTWYGHILKGHPEMTRARSLVERAIRAPVEVRISNSDPNCRLYYGQGPRSGLLVVVVAEIALGVVKTAHFAKKITGGSVEWSSPTP